MWFFWGKGASGFSASSTAEEVTRGIDATGLTAIVTGGASGVGAETARVLALRGAYVVIGDRNMAAGKETIRSILKQNPAAKVELMELDLGSISSVENFVAQFKATNLPLNLLIKNAGVMGIPFALSVDKIERHFAINHVGHFLLTDLLLDTMKNTALKSKIEGRIVNVASMAHFCCDFEQHFDNINNKTGYNCFLAYRVSKLATMLHATDLARRLKEEEAHLTVNSLHPGVVGTRIADHHPLVQTFIIRYTRELLKKLLAKDVHQGAATTCYVALHPQVKGVSGKYFTDCNLSKPWAQATDINLAAKLCDFTSNLIKSRR